MKISNKDLIRAFWQQGANNCAAIGLIKAAIETFGLNNVFSIEKRGDHYTALLKNGHSVTFTETNLQKSMVVGSFQDSKDPDTTRHLLHKQIQNYAQLCFAVMVAQYDSINQINDFNKALDYLSNGANARYISPLLGLEEYASPQFRGGENNTGMIAWIHNPFRKHVVYMSQGSYDLYGEERFDTHDFPKRIKLNEQPISEFANKLEVSELNFLNISRHGTFQDTGKVHSIPQHVDRIIKHIKENRIENLLIHFHGGLISENMGMDSAEKFYDNFKDAGNTHVLTIVWETGFLEALPETFKRILQSDELLRKMIQRVAKFLAKKFGIDTANLDLKMSGETVENYASLIAAKTGEMQDEDIPDYFVGYKSKISQNSDLENQILIELKEIMHDEDLNEENIERVRKSENKNASINPKLLWYIAKIAKRCIVRFIKKTGHGVWPTIIEECSRELYLDDFGTEIWQTMKNQASNMWSSNQNKTDLEQYAGRYLFDKLIENFEPNDLAINIVGHSAGAVAACEWINCIKSEEKYASFKFNNLIFLAPACTCELFKSTVMKFPETYSHFRMFTMYDKFEKTDNLIPVPVLGLLYTRSLLYLISGILEGSRPEDADAYILGLHRHIRKSDPYSEVTMLNEISDFLMLPNESSSRVILSTTKESAENGRKASAIHHGGFAKDQLVVQSIKHLIKSN